MQKAWVIRGCLLIVVGIACVGSYFIGGLIGHVQVYNRQARDQILEIEPILAKEPQFAGLRVEHCSAGWVMVTGQVGSPAVKARLRQDLVPVIGVKRAEFAVDFVQVQK